ncbi:MAPEG family protein [Thalassotalea sp. ND16A]|uniref:MAPEG family protein n=1 Tax=Thalassotalea sp. ND16A TaxID=1535422 RepID=UPI00051A1926|nr:MAPEG family protein [Thalassotalea sp. ND16A]KGJ99284.1 hypothetical protein ND16A_3805 [Thalassotalea sp. ND16A]
MNSTELAFSTELIAPMFTLMCLTALVWLYMYTLRLSYVIKHKIHAQQLSSPELIPQLLPEHINRPANNFKNLFELPVIFYALMLLALLTNTINQVILYTSWFFVFSRILHSIVQCTYNKVMHRFVIYIIGAIALWLLLAQLLLSLI